MNDRFKFRAWDKQSRKIYNVTDLSFHYDTLKIEYIYLNIPDTDYCKFIDNPDKYTLMQCTGLKDKNGVLIYEGDIVKENWHTYVIDYDRGYSINDIKTKCSYTISTLCNEKSEVIGNIYENPELLEENKKC